MMEREDGYAALRSLLKPFLTVPRRLYCAVSGGADSMALATFADALWQEGFLPEAPVLLHVNHGLRGQASDADEAFVCAWAKDHGLSVAVGHFDVRQHAKATGTSIETAARNVRYTFFEEQIRNGHDSVQAKPLLLLAHHAQDQAESILLHICRGSGTDGLAGMRPCEERRSYWLLRPFLFVPKQKLIGALQERQQSWREDATNGQREATRNRLRLDILPQLRNDVNPALDDALLRLGVIVADESDYMEDTAAACLAKLVEPKSDQDPFSGSLLARNAHLLKSMALPRQAFLALPIALQRRVIRQWVFSLAKDKKIEPISLLFRDIEEIRGYFSKPTGKWLGLYGIMFLTDFEGVHALTQKCFMTLETEEETPFSLPIQSHMQQVTSRFGLWTMTFQAQATPATVSSLASLPAACCALNAEGLSGLEWRFALSEDLFIKFGGGQKPLRKMWNAWHVPSLLRKHWPVVTDGKDILWVPGLGRSAVRKVQVGQAMVTINWRRV